MFAYQNDKEKVVKEWALHPFELCPNCQKMDTVCTCTSRESKDVDSLTATNQGCDQKTSKCPKAAVLRNLFLWGIPEKSQILAWDFIKEGIHRFPLKDYHRLRIVATNLAGSTAQMLSMKEKYLSGLEPLPWLEIKISPLDELCQELQTPYEGQTMEWIEGFLNAISNQNDDKHVFNIVMIDGLEAKHVPQDWRTKLTFDHQNLHWKIGRAHV